MVFIRHLSKTMASQCMNPLSDVEFCNLPYHTRVIRKIMYPLSSPIFPFYPDTVNLYLLSSSPTINVE